MATILTTVTLPSTTGILRDAAQNTIVLGGALPQQGNTQPLVQAISRLYNRPAQSNVMLRPSTYISGNRSRAVAGCPVKFYDISNAMAGQPHGSPVAVDAFTLGAAGGAGPLPEECALVLTLRVANYTSLAVEAPDDSDADTGVERIRQRGSGRMYWGPFSLDASVAGDSGYARPAPNLINALGGSAQDFAAELATLGYTWRIWSREATAALPVASVQVDNAFDTQRRRGAPSTTRTSFVV